MLFISVYDIVSGEKKIMDGVDIEMLCDVCDEAIHVKKYEDANRAYARHIQTSYHLEIAERFRSIKLGEDNATFPSNLNFSSGDVSQNEASIPPNFIQSFSLFYCRLCQININDSTAMTQHLNGVKHLMLESFVRDLNNQRALLKLMGYSHKQTFQTESNEILSYFSNMNVKGTRVCLVCNCTVFAEGKYLLNHTLYDENHLVKLNTLFMNWGNDESFYCIICNVKDREGAEEHCGGDVHRNAIDLLYKFARHGMF